MKTPYAYGVKNACTLDGGTLEEVRQNVVEAMEAEETYASTGGHPGLLEDLVGPGGKFVIPAEEPNDLLGDEELDVGSEIGVPIRKLGRVEFVKMNPKLAFSTKVLIDKANPDAMDEKTYYVMPKLRAPVAAELRFAKFVPCYSLATKRPFLWQIKISDTNWYRSLELLLRKPPEFFANNAIRVRADKALGHYRIFTSPDSTPVSWPTEPTDELVTEALRSTDAIINSPDHPVYANLIAGTELK